MYDVYRELLAFTCPIFASRFFTRSNLLVSFAFNTGLVHGYTERMSQSDLVVVQSYATEGDAELRKASLSLQASMG